MKWIKTSERLPSENDCAYHIRYKDLYPFAIGVETFYELESKMWLEKIEEWLDESEEEIIIPTLDLITNFALQASIGKLSDNERRMVITTTCMNEEQAKLFLQDMRNKLNEELEKEMMKITDTQRLDWIALQFSNCNKPGEVFPGDMYTYNLREFIDKQLNYKELC